MPQIHSAETSTTSVPSAATDGYACPQGSWLEITMVETTAGGAADIAKGDLYFYTPGSGRWQVCPRFAVDGTMTVTNGGSDREPVWTGAATRYDVVVSAAASGAGLSAWGEEFADKTARA